MREILFRGRRIDNKEWIEGYLLVNGEHAFIAYYDNTRQYRPHKERVDPATIGQYTGIRDKNGKRIFEGDIVRMHYFFEAEVIGEVKISPLGTYTETENGAYDWGDYLQEPSEELEVISTINDKQEVRE